MKVFLSHNSRDKPVAEHIGENLIKQGIDTWLDKWDMFAGESLTTRIGDAIEKCDAFVVLLSPNATGSKWVKEELRIAIQRRFAEDDFRIIPLVLAPCAIPAFLRDYLYIDFRNGTSAGCQALISALQRSTSRPLAPKSKPAISYKRAFQSLQLIGVRGERTVIHERFTAVPLRNLKQIDRNIYFSGQLSPIRCDKFRVAMKAISPNYEKLILKPKSPHAKGRAFEFALEYELTGTFVRKEEYWIYAIEAPTDECRIEFDFTESQMPASLSVAHHQGSSAHKEIVQPIRTSRDMFVWQKPYPEYKDTYEFRIRWR